MYGWAGKILDVNLTSGKIEKVPLDSDLAGNYLGGRGINSRILYDQMAPGVDPLSPDNLLIFGTGPLGGTIAPSSNRMSITAKSIMYNGVGTSNAGGRFGPELKWAGYDHLIFRGKANEPVYLWIDDDQVELRPAAHLWGKNAWETDHLIKEELGDPEIKVACIGPAGEKQVHFSVIMFTMYRAAGQTGMGAVMGSKNLKAVAVRGTGSIQVAHPRQLRDLTLELTRRIKAKKTYAWFSTHGTPAMMMVDNKMGALAVRNYQQSGEWKEIDNISPEAIFKYYTKDKSCHACPMHCSHFFEVKDGPYKGEKGGGVEAGTTYMFGAMLGNSDVASLFRCLNLSNQYGLDTIEVCYTMAAAMEWYEKGIITEKDTDGLALEWGDPEVIIELIHKIGKREGFGDVLAQGGIHAAHKIGKGAEDFVSHCKGMMIGGDEPRMAKGTALNYVTATIPSHHEEGAPAIGSPKKAKALFGDESVANPLAYNKAAATVYYQNICTVMDAVEICKFISGWVSQEISLKEAADLFAAATGIEMTPEDMELAGERIHDLERAFAVREGMTRKDDRLHGKIMKEAIQSGPHKGERIDREKFEAMLEDYYELRGWDRATGIPSRAKLERVGLKDVADDLEKMGKLPKKTVSSGKKRGIGK